LVEWIIMFIFVMSN